MGDLETEKEWLELMNRLISRLHDEYNSHHKRWKSAENSIRVNTVFREVHFPKEIPDGSYVVNEEGEIFTVLSTEENTFFGKLCQCGVDRNMTNLYVGGCISIYKLTVIDEEEYRWRKELILTGPVGPKCD